jgi:hypothetical protein
MNNNDFLWGAQARLRIGEGDAALAFRKDLYAAFTVDAELDDASCLVIAIWLSSRNKEWRDKMINRVREIFGDMDSLQVTAKIMEMMDES